MSRILTVHLHHDPSDHWLQALLGASVYEDRCYVDTYTTQLAILDLREASCAEIGHAVKLCRSLSRTLGCPLVDKDGEPWSDEGLDALTKAVVG